MFLTHYGSSETKGSFPYELVKCLGDLDRTDLPSHREFYSNLRGRTISLEAYNVVETAWRENQMRTLFDLLKWYSLLDVRPFLESSVLNYLKPYKARSLDLFKSAISLPGISILWAFDTVSDDIKFHLFSPRHADIE